MWPLSVARRNEVGVRSATRTGPFQGPGIQTTYSSPSRIPPISPLRFTNRATSNGDARLGSAARADISSSGDIRASRTRSR